MTLWIVIAAMAVAAAGAAAWLQGSSRGGEQSQIDALRQDMQTLVAAQSQAVNAQISQLSQTVVAQTGQVLQQVQSGMASSGTLASNVQKAVAEQLQARPPR